MTDSNDLSSANLNLSAEEKRAFSYLFAQADKDQLGVITGENAVAFFERTKVSAGVLGEIWQIADTENRGLLTKPGFSIVLRLIGHYQAGREPSAELAFRPGPVPKFEGLQIPGVGPTSPTQSGMPSNALQPQMSGSAPIRVPPLDPQKVQQYTGLFQQSGAQNGQIDGATAKSIFERAGLPNETLGRIWNLADREQKGALNQAEFIVAMHLLTSVKMGAMSTLPTILPPGLYEAAARRGPVQPPSRQATGASVIPKQLTGNSAGAPPRIASPLSRTVGFNTPSPVSAASTGPAWLVTTADKAKFDQFFTSIDPQGRGVLSGEQAVTFFSDSRLPEETLAQIWDLADINSEGQLNRDEFAVAMYLIRQQRAANPGPLPAFLPPALVPPSMRKVPQQAVSTAPAFPPSNISKSAAEDLFGLDEPASPTPAVAPLPTVPLQVQGTGASASRDPFASSQPASPASPRRFQPQQPQPSSLFKPFMPTSAFGASLAQQNTGGSVNSSAVAPAPVRGVSAPVSQPQPAAMDDLLGDNETHAAESSKLTSETTELANMSSQIGNLRNQMEQTQAKKSTTQADLNATSSQKRDLELRLQQFRSQYEQEVRAVKELEQQLTVSKDSTTKMSQELAMLEGTYQDLTTQHQTTLQSLQADQQENAALKERLALVNAEVARLKPEIEKLKLDARQQKGLVSINRKQLATTEGERDKLQAERADLELEVAELEEQRHAAEEQRRLAEEEAAAATAAAATAKAAAAAAPPAPVEHFSHAEPAPSVASPASTLSATNPFFRSVSHDASRDVAISPPIAGHSSGAPAPNPTAFDTLFGPSAAFAPMGQAHSRAGTPPATSFIGRSVPAATAATGLAASVASLSSAGEPTPSATPPALDRSQQPSYAAEPPPPPASRQFTASHLPVVDPEQKLHDVETDSTKVVPPASRAGGLESPLATSDDYGMRTPSVEPVESAEVPGSFPTENWQTGEAHDRDHALTQAQKEVIPSADESFDAAFAGFSGKETSTADDKDADPFAPRPAHGHAAGGAGIRSEFPPIQSLEIEDDDDSDDEPERRFDDNFTAASPPRNNEHESTQASTIDGMQFPKVPALDDSSRMTVASTSAAPSAVSEALPAPDALPSPPKYEESNAASHGGPGERTGSNQFPPEFGSLLPAREEPVIGGNSRPSDATPTQDGRVGVEAASSKPDFNHPPVQAVDEFDDAFSQPLTQAVEAEPTSTQHPMSSQKAKTPFDEFDDFDNLADAEEADKTNGLDFGFGSQSAAADEFNPAFDSPAISTTNTMTSAHQTPIATSRTTAATDSFAASSSFATASAFSSSAADSNLPPGAPQQQHDWDSIFSGLDNPKPLDTSLAANDPWAPTSGTTASATNSARLAAPVPAKSTPRSGGALTPGTEHDDPILKRLTGMGYPRADALNALEKYDYDINQAVDHLSR